MAERRRVRLAIHALEDVLERFREVNDGEEWARLARLWILERDATTACELSNLVEIFVETRDGFCYCSRPWLARRLASFMATAAHYVEFGIELTAELREDMRAGEAELVRWLDPDDRGPYPEAARPVDWPEWAKERL